jgi:small subunit ribosomal protein S8
MTDPIDAMLNTLKMASFSGKTKISVPFSKVKFAIAICLSKEGYVGKVVENKEKKFPILDIEVVYETDKSPKIHEVKRLSKSSRRLYTGSKKLGRTHGLLVLSTPKGILTSREAKKEMVGGEVLFRIW